MATFIRSAAPQMAAQHPDVSLGEFLELAGDIFENAAVKFLAKRRKEDRPITHLLLFQSRGKRHLVARQGWVAEEDYRDIVASFERDFVETGLVSEPLVVTAQEWRRYTDQSLPPATEDG